MHVVLVVEDNSIERKITSACIEDLNYEVIEASDGSNAIDILEKNKVDVIVTDINMSGMSGVELIAVCKKNFPNIPVIAMSGYIDIEEYSRTLQEYKVFAAFNKPINLEKLGMALEKAVSSAS